MFHRRRTRFKFTEKKHSKKGILTLAGAVALLAIFAVFVLAAYRTNGGLNTYYGSAGVFAILLSITAVVFSVQSMMEENSFMLFPRFAFAMSIISLLLWTVTYLSGFGLL